MIQFQSTLQTHGLKTVFSTPNVLLRTKVTYWAEGSKITFALAVPTMFYSDSLLEAYRLDERMVSAPNSSDVEMEFVSQHSVIAVDSDR